MILLINNDKNKDVEGTVDEKTFSELGIWERKHIEEWIAEYPEILGEKLLTVTTEYDKFDKTTNRLDILAVDTNGKLVIVELKRDVADKFVDLQAIHYAAYCSTLNKEQIIEIMSNYYPKMSKEAAESELNLIIENNEDFTDFDNQPRIILVANDFREETLAAVLWLRDLGADITCVKLEPYLIGEYIAVNSEVIIPLPEAKDYMMKIVDKKKSSSTKTPYQKDLYNFWKKVLALFKERKPGITDLEYVSTPWLLLPTNYKSIHFEWFFRRRQQKGFFVALHFERKYEENRAICKYFKDKEKEIQNQFPEEKILFGGNDNLAPQVYVMRESTDFDDENLKWGVNSMIKLYDILNPLVTEYFQNKS